MPHGDESDPRCPECGEKVSPTAYYCMHCHADLPDNQTESVSTDNTAESGNSFTDRVTSTTDEILSDEPDRPKKEMPTTASPSSSTASERHKLEGVAGRLVSLLVTDVPDPEGVPRDTFHAPLWMRVPAAFFAGLFVFAALEGVTIVLVGEWLGPLSGLVTLALFFGAITWLVRKPLVSDIIADACYAIALAILLSPAAFMLNGLLSQVISADPQGLGDIFVVGSVMQIFVLFPASFLLVVGFLGNRYARGKLDTLAENATDPANQ